LFLRNAAQGSARQGEGDDFVFSDELLTIEELAGYLKLKPRTLYLKLRRGDIPAYKVFKEWRVRRSDLEEWLSKNIRPKREKSATEIQQPVESQF